MNAQQQRRNTAVAVTIIVLVLLAVLGIALYIITQKKPTGPVASPSPSPAVETPTPEPTATPSPGTRKLLGTHNVIPKDTLWWISDKWYKDPVLWPSIFEINKAQIRDPDLIYPGQKFDIPALTGSAAKLSPDDRSLLAQGYLEAYRVYKEKGRQDAQDYKRTGDRLSK